jgi:hypothetical protein
MPFAVLLVENSQQYCGRRLDADPDRHATSLARKMWPAICDLYCDRRSVPPALTNRTACPGRGLSCEFLAVPVACIK